MKKIIAVLSLTLTACATNERALTVKGFSYVQHHKEKSNGAWVEGFDNKAVGVEYTFRKTAHTEVGVGGTIVPDNSYGNFGATLHVTGSVCTDTALRACTGLSGGIAYGYEPQTGMPVVPAVLWTNKISYDRWGLEHNHLPSIDKEYINGLNSDIIGFDELFLTYTIPLN